MNSISVIIPFYNRANFLPRVLESVAQQVYRPIELILVDNGSTDNSKAICEQFQTRYQSLNFTIQLIEENKKGANAARNAGLKIAQSEYVTFFDSDDEMFPCMLKDIAKAIQIYSTDIIAYTYAFREENGKEYVKIHCYSNKVRMQIIRGMLSTQNWTAKKELLLAVGGWNETLLRWQDWELGIRLLLQTQSICWIKNQPLCRAYIHKERISGDNYTHSHNDLSDTLYSASMDIQNSRSSEKNKLLRALLYRKILLAGLYAREGHKRLGKRYLNQILDEVHSEYLQCILSLLYKYVSLGGRGSWIIACCFL